jgi:hypothetical protein
MAAARTLRL